MADHKEGFLVVSISGVDVEHPPVHAKKAVAAACPDGTPTLDVGAVKLAYPDPVEQCPGVTVRAQDPIQT